MLWTVRSSVSERTLGTIRVCVALREAAFAIMTKPDKRRPRQQQKA